MAADKQELAPQTFPSVSDGNVLHRHPVARAELPARCEALPAARAQGGQLPPSWASGQDHQELNGKRAKMDSVQLVTSTQLP